jgi:hypothetical protein
MGKYITRHINTLMMKAEAVSKMLDPSISIHACMHARTHTHTHTHTLYFINLKSLSDVGYETYHYKFFYDNDYQSSHILSTHVYKKYDLS